LFTKRCISLSFHFIVKIIYLIIIYIFFISLWIFILTHHEKESSEHVRTTRQCLWIVRRLPLSYEIFSRCHDLVTRHPRLFTTLLQPLARHDLWIRCTRTYTWINTWPEATIIGLEKACRSWSSLLADAQ